MRQAGRSLPEYRAVRAGHRACSTPCARPDLVTEITLQPVRRYGVDAAILFSDIVVPLKAIGVDLDIVPGRGPGRRPAVPDRGGPGPAARADAGPGAVRHRGGAAAGRRARPDAADRLRGCAVHARVVPGRGRPVEGPRADQGADVRRPGAVARAARPAGRDRRDVPAGAGRGRRASAVQLFDSWVGALPLADYRELRCSRTRPRRWRAVADLGVPRIHFGVGTGELLGGHGRGRRRGRRRRLPGVAGRGGRAGRPAPRGAGQPRPGGCCSRPGTPVRATGARRCWPTPADSRATCSTWATACRPKPTRTCWPGSSTWCTCRRAALTGWAASACVVPAVSPPARRRRPGRRSASVDAARAPAPGCRAAASDDQRTAAARRARSATTTSDATKASQPRCSPARKPVSACAGLARARPGRTSVDGERGQVDRVVRGPSAGPPATPGRSRAGTARPRSRRCRRSWWPWPAGPGSARRWPSGSPAGWPRRSSAG